VPFDDGLLVDADVTRHARALGPDVALREPGAPSFSATSCRSTASSSS
jgi:hypothetical protein